MINRSIAYFFLFVAMISFGTGATAASATTPLLLAQRPLFIGDVPPLNMLIMSRDHKLYYAAYNDASDLDGDGVIDIHYKPSIDYYGYFDSHKCYDWDNSKQEFYASSNTTTKQCSGKWSGDFLNYLTMSRIDLIRKALYGGKRSVDAASTGGSKNRNTILERAFVPQDTHSWAKQYTSVAIDGYDISKYTPYSLPGAGTRHLFATTNLNGTQDTPRLRVVQNTSKYAWDWGATESNACFGVSGATCTSGLVLPTFSATGGTNGNEFYVRVRVCDSTSATGLESNCKAYGSGTSTIYKPIGRLQSYGENNSMMFGLITGSFDTNVSGGRLRKGISTITDEILSTGQFNSAVVGVIRSIDALKTIKFSGSYSDCSLAASSAASTNSLSPAADGACVMWGNPVGEMMYEALRYFGGGTAATPSFVSGVTNDTTVGLPLGAWPTKADGVGGLYTDVAKDALIDKPPFSRCAKPFMMVLSDIYPSFDSDALPNSYFGPGLSNDVLKLDVSTVADTIWSEEGLGTKTILIGQSGTSYDGAPTAKSTSSFSQLRGLVPEEPTRQGSYYAPAVAYYGKANDVNASVADDQKVTTIAVAFASPVPKIEIPVAGKTITLVPFAKSVKWPGSQTPASINYINPTSSGTQPTNSFAGFYVDTLTPTYGKFRVNFEDQEKGNDYDLDAVVIYEYLVNTAAGTVTVTTTSNYAAGGIIQHMGYVISGTTKDGLYLEVRDKDTGSGSDVDAKLDTPPGIDPGGVYADGVDLPLVTSRTFSPNTSTTPSAMVLKDPLWYAAKYGGFFEDTRIAPPNDKPDVTAEWDSTGTGTPDAYILISTPNLFEQQMDRAFYEVFKRIGSAASVATATTSTKSAVTIYQGRFQTAGPDWNGELLAYPFDAKTGKVSPYDWNAADLLKTPDTSTRLVWTWNPTTNLPVDFQYTNLDTTQKAALDLNPSTLKPDGGGLNRVAYLRGDATNEGIGVNNFRKRSASKLGDIINSSPFYVGDFLATGAKRDPVVYVGANDGMLHAFSGKAKKDGGGTELFAYVPNAVLGNLNKLTDKIYNHQFYTDGSPAIADAKLSSGWKSVLVAGLNAGGAGIYALDVTDPANFTSASANKIPLWEFTETDDKVGAVPSGDMGFTYGKPVIAQVKAGATSTWVAIFSNGYNSTNGKGVLYIVALEKTGPWTLGTNFFKISVPGTGNGLSAPVAMDIEQDGYVDYVYAGDLNGKLWRFDVRDITALVATEVFQATDSLGAPQPITSRPDVTVHPSNSAETLVLFGTGRYLTSGDVALTSTQSFYAVWDKLTGVTSSLNRLNLQQQEIIGTVDAKTDTGPTGTTVTYTPSPRPGSSPVSSATYTSLMPAVPAPVTSTTPTSAAPISSTTEFRVTSKYSVDWSSQSGWFIDLDYPANTGERITARPVLQNKLILFSTLQPSTDSCKEGGLSYLMGLKFDTGGQDPRKAFDTNADLKFDGSDFLSGGVSIGATVGGVTVIYPSGDVSGYSGKGAGENGIAVGPPADAAGGPAPPVATDCTWVATSGTAGGLSPICVNPGAPASGRVTWRELINQ